MGRREPGDPEAEPNQSPSPCSPPPPPASQTPCYCLGGDLAGPQRPFPAAGGSPEPRPLLSKPSERATGALTVIPEHSSFTPALWRAGRKALPLAHSTSILHRLLPSQDIQKWLGSVRRWGSETLTAVLIMRGRSPLSLHSRTPL